MTTKGIDEDGKKTAITLTLPGFEVQVDDEEIAEGNYTFEKTGKTKMIAGYRCVQYRGETEENSGDIWTSEDLQFDFR